MADDDLLVTISGPALSLLLYENARCHDQIGFLLGETQIFRTKKVTDSERAVENIQTHINIKSIVPHPSGCEPFFNTPGHLDEERLKEFLKTDIKKVVGWYHYRYDFKIELDSLRDRNLHIGLSKFFSDTITSQSQENFLFFLMGTTENETCGTHKFKHVLYRRERKAYKAVSFKINNLGSDASRPDGSDYKSTPMYTTCQYDSFENVYETVRDDLKRLSGVEAVQLIEKAAEKYLAKLVPEVNKTDKIVTELSEKLVTMKRNFYTQHWEQMFKLQLQMHQCSMEVDTQPLSQNPLPPITITKSEPMSPDSPPMYDPPKISPSSSTIKQATRKPLKQEIKEERTRDTVSRDRETNQTKTNIPKSPQTTGDSDWKSVSQRRAEFEKKNVRKSPTYDRKNS